MSDERRRQQRRERQRRRVTNRPPAQPVPEGAMPLPGIFGWMQRNGRLFALVGVVVLTLSLGATFIGMQPGNTNPDVPEITPEASATPTAAPTPTPTFGPTGTPSADGVFRTYTAAPPMTINERGRYEALIRTERGDIRVQLLPEANPEHVNNFVFLAKNKFYDGLTFHRVVQNFAAQAGDPLANSQGGPGYILEPQLNSVEFDEGIVAMAAGQAGVSGSQFFITMSPQPALKTNGFSAFGRVTEGIEVVKSLTLRDPTRPNQPPGDRIISVQIVER